jgi:hypothetical protein
VPLDLVETRHEARRRLKKAADKTA